MNGPRIYKSGDYLHLVFDPLPGNQRTHSVAIPITQKGFNVLIKILSDRERSPFVDKAHIATDEVPIQSMVEEWLKSNTIKTVKKDAPNTLTLEDLDL